MCNIDKETEKKLAIIQEPLEIELYPFQKYADKLGITVAEVLELLKKYLSAGIIRRVAGIVKHDRAGFGYNAMVAFEIDEQLCDDAGMHLSECSFITHCYKRTAYPDWAYNVYAMIHARDEFEFNQYVESVKKKITFKSMVILRSLKEYKKTHYQIRLE
jgi:DNA-binding Lrp family transcriptional regulator